MRNPFKKNNWHNEEHDDIYDLLYDLSSNLIVLATAVNELRKEVDFLVDKIDD